MITGSSATTTDPRARRCRTRRSRTCRRSWLLSPTPWGATWLWMTTATRRSTPSPWCDSRKPDSEERGIFPPWRPDQHCGLEPGREARQNRRHGAGQWSHAGVDPSQDMGHACFSFPVEKLTCTFACVWPPICFCRFLWTSFASVMDPNGNHDMPLSWDLEGDGQSAANLICDTMAI